MEAFLDSQRIPVLEHLAGTMTRVGFELAADDLTLVAAGVSTWPTPGAFWWV